MLRSDDLERLIINYTRRLQMLKEQKAIMGISADPRILIEIEDIEAEIENLQKERSLSESLEERLDQQMLGWFQTLGYRFESYRIRNEDYSEWVINIPARRGYERILVRGVNGEAEMNDFIAFREKVEENRTDEGWLVAMRRVASSVRAACQEPENERLFCYTFDELLDDQADFSGYLDWLEKEIKDKEIDHAYVSLSCTKEEFHPITHKKIATNHYDYIEAYIDQWLDDPTKAHISILGEFGTGKTWFCLHYAWLLLQRYKDAKARGLKRPRLPLVIPLRDYAKAVSVESLFSEFFFRKHEIPLPGYSAFELLNRMGKLLLIFDGFDEMAARIDRQKMINNFLELAQVIVPGAKAILTCRNEHFPHAKEGRDLLNAKLKASTANLTGRPPQFEVLHLEKFNDKQIHQVLSVRAKTETVEHIMMNEALLDLARRPVMTDFLIEALPEIEAGKPVDLSRVYLYAVRRKMERDIRAERTFTSLADKLYFMAELSWEMLSGDQMSLNYRLFPDRLRSLFGTIVEEKIDLDHWHYDMMGQTLLIRNSDGDYMPAHRSLLEFFVAYKFAAQLGVLAADFTEIAQLQSHVDNNLTPQDYTWSTYFLRKANKKGEIISIPQLRNFSNEEPSYITAIYGARFSNKAVLDLITKMISLERLENNPAKNIIEQIGQYNNRCQNCLGEIHPNRWAYLDDEIYNELHKLPIIGRNSEPPVYSLREYLCINCGWRGVIMSVGEITP